MFGTNELPTFPASHLAHAWGICTNGVRFAPAVFLSDLEVTITSHPSLTLFIQLGEISHPGTQISLLEPLSKSSPLLLVPNPCTSLNNL